MDDAAAFSLDQIRTASPCPVKWSSMTGDDRIRHCRHCDLNVYNLSAFTRAKAEAIVLEHEGRLCAKYWRRADGTVITKDCPVGAAEVRRKRARVLTAAAALLSLGVGAVASLTLGESRWNAARVKLSGVEPFATVRGWFVTPPAPPALAYPGGCTLGSVASPVTVTYPPPTFLARPSDKASSTDDLVAAEDDKP